jgi:hypothetical protein
MTDVIRFRAACAVLLALLAWTFLAGSATTPPVRAAQAPAAAVTSAAELSKRCVRDVDCKRKGNPRDLDATKPQGTFWIHGDPILKFQVGRGEAVPAADAIEIQGDMARTHSGCDWTPIRIAQDGNLWHVTADWKNCGGAVWTGLEGDIDAASGGTFQGDLHIDFGGRPTTVQDFPIIATLTRNEAVRMGTYNTKFLTSSAPVDYDKYPEDAAEKISERIIAGGYDWVALQEVWDQDAKRNDEWPMGFVDMLSGTYPYYVEYLSSDGGELSFHEDSGIMLFSRFKFLPLDNDYYVLPIEQCFGTDCDRTAFIEFDSCDDDDCMAEKGAGLVRLENPATKRVYNVAFTHLQAPYYDDSPDNMLATYNTRGEQMDEIQTLLETTLDSTSFQSEEIYLMGDLNIDGDLGNPNLGPPPSNPTDATYFVHNKYEWMRKFDNGGQFWTDRMRDLWAFTTSPQDRGQSAPRNYEGYFSPPEGRLDYIVGKRNSRLCTQHMTLAHNLRWGAPYVTSGMGEVGTEAGSMEMSDHLGVNADINLRAPYCSPREALDLDLNPGDFAFQPGQITYDGSMQWIRFDQPGTYGFALTSPGPVDYQVYSSRDLSMPLINYKELTRTLEVGKLRYELEMFVVPEAPFYVRTFVPNSPWSGGYTFIAKSYGCTSMADACILTPGIPDKRVFPAGSYIGSEDAMWFELHTESTGWDKPGGVKVDTGVAQNLEFEVDKITPADPDQLRMEVTDSGGGVTISDGNAEPDTDDPNYGSVPTDRLYAQLQEPGSAVRFIKVYREDPALEQKFEAQWRTNLTVLVGLGAGVPDAAALDFSIVDHGDAFGDEEYYWWMLADGAAAVDEGYIDEQSEPSNVTLEPWITAVRYVSEARPIWVEIDGDYDGGYVLGEDDDDDVIQAGIGPLDPNTGCVTKQHVTMHDDEDYGKYVFSYNLCHGLATP